MDGIRFGFKGDDNGNGVAYIKSHDSLDVPNEDVKQTEQENQSEIFEAKDLGAAAKNKYSRKEMAIRAEAAKEAYRLVFGSAYKTMNKEDRSILYQYLHWHFTQEVKGDIEPTDPSLQEEMKKMFLNDLNNGSLDVSEDAKGIIRAICENIAGEDQEAIIWRVRFERAGKYPMENFSSLAELEKKYPGIKQDLNFTYDIQEKIKEYQAKGDFDFSEDLADPQEQKRRRDFLAAIKLMQDFEDDAKFVVVNDGGIKLTYVLNNQEVKEMNLWKEQYLEAGNAIEEINLDEEEFKLQYGEGLPEFCPVPNAKKGILDFITEYDGSIQQKDLKLDIDKFVKQILDLPADKKVVSLKNGRTFVVENKNVAATPDAAPAEKPKEKTPAEIYEESLSNFSKTKLLDSTIDLYNEIKEVLNEDELEQVMIQAIEKELEKYNPGIAKKQLAAQHMYSLVKENKQ